MLTAVVGCLSACPAGAVTLTYSLKDIGTFTGYSDSNRNDTFAGTGFVGLYNGSFGHLLGSEGTSSHTALEVDISGLTGKTIQSATLSYKLLNGSNGTQTASLTSFDANGILTNTFNAPNNLGTPTFTENGLGANTIDVTGLLSNRVASGKDWFGLYLAGTSQYMWTYTYGGFGYTNDSAQLQLTVNATNATPEPGAFALMASCGLSGVGLLVRKRRRHRVSSRSIG